MNAGGIGGHAEQTDLGAHQCAVGFIEIQQFKALIVAGQLQVLADKTPCQTLQTAVFKVHGQKSYITVDVGEAEGLVEFDAVENHHLAIDQRGIPQVDITVAFTDKPLGFTLLEQRFKADETALSPGLKGIQLLQVGFICQKRPNLIEVLAHRLHDGFWSALVVFQRYMGRLGMKMSNLLGHFINVRGSQLAIGLQRAQQLALRELKHFQRVLDHHPVTADHRRIGCAGDGQYFKV